MVNKNISSSIFPPINTRVRCLQWCGWCSQEFTNLFCCSIFFSLTPAIFEVFILIPAFLNSTLLLLNLSSGSWSKAGCELSDRKLHAVQCCCLCTWYLVKVVCCVYLQNKAFFSPNLMFSEFPIRIWLNSFILFIYLLVLLTFLKITKF